jgi:hypothetical protein
VPTSFQKGISSQSGSGALSHTISACTAGRRLVVLNDYTSNGFTDGPTGITGVTIGGVAMTRIGYVYAFPGGPFLITSLYLSDPLTGGETTIAVSSDAGGFWQSDIVYAEVSGLGSTLDVQNSFDNFDVALSIGFTTGFANSFGISGAGGGTPTSSGWANISGSTTACYNDDLGAASAETLAFTNLGSANSRSVVVYAIRASGGSTPVVPTVGSLAIAGNAATRIVGTILQPTQGALALAGIAPTVSTGSGVTRQPTAGTLALAGLAPSITRRDTITPTVGAAVLAGQTPGVSVGGSITRQPLTGALVFAGASPTLDLTLPSPVTGTLTLTGVAPNVTVSVAGNIQPSTGALSLTGNAPTVTRQTFITPSTAVMALSGQLATVARQTIIAPVAGALNLAGLSANLTQQLLKAPTAGALTLSGLAPNVTVSTLGTIIPQVGVLALVGNAPGIIRRTTISPTTGAALLTGNAPAVNTTGPKLITGLTGSLSFSGLAPAVAIAPIGGSYIQVPQFLGMLLTDAAQLAANLGFTNILATQVMSNRTGGVVLTQNYAYGDYVPPAIALVLTVADGAVPANTIDTRPYLP